MYMQVTICCSENHNVEEKWTAGRRKQHFQEGKLCCLFLKKDFFGKVQKSVCFMWCVENTLENSPNR